MKLGTEDPWSISNLAYARAPLNPLSRSLATPGLLFVTNQHYPSKVSPRRGRSTIGVLALLSVLVPILFATVESASAATNCRKVMRDLQVQMVQTKSNVNANPTAEESSKIQNIFVAKVVALPECKTEFGIWIQWNQQLNPSTPFPFGEASDPRVYPLGPVSWWWDKIYIDLFGRNIILMFLFGWEIFLGGLWAVLAISSMILGTMPSLGMIVSIPFRLLRRRSKRNKKELPPENLGLEEE
jgi:hypothetical protein